MTEIHEGSDGLANGLQKVGSVTCCKLDIVAKPSVAPSLSPSRTPSTGPSVSPSKAPTTDQPNRPSLLHCHLHVRPVQVHQFRLPRLQQPISRPLLLHGHQQQSCLLRLQQA